MNINKLKFVGRYIVKNDYYYIFNGGSGFSFKMKGKGFKVSFNSSPKQGYYYIIIDRDYDNKVKVSTSESGYYHFRSKGIHFVDIVKANEFSDNVFELKEFEVDGELLDNDHVYDYKVKVYGDSTIAGFGILGHNEVASVHTSDSVEDFCYQALYELNMDMDIMSASGFGLTFSAYTCPKNVGVIDYIDKVAVGSHVSWNNNQKADLLIISLGCNDNSYIQENISRKDELVKKFINEYQKLIDTEIKLNKDLKILMVYGTLKEETAYYLYEETYNKLKPLYKNLYIHKFDGDNTAISNHAFVTAHKRMAKELKEVVKSILK